MSDELSKKLTEDHDTLRTLSSGSESVSSIEPRATRPYYPHVTICLSDYRIFIS
jgi:hypothetical protein